MHRIERRYLLLTAVLILLIAILAGCSAGQPEPLSGRDNQVTNAAVDGQELQQGDDQRGNSGSGDQQKAAGGSDTMSDEQPAKGTGDKAVNTEETPVSSGQQAVNDSKESPEGNKEALVGGKNGGSPAQGEPAKEGAKSSENHTGSASGTSKPADQSAPASSEKPASGTVKTSKPADSTAPADTNTGKPGSTNAGTKPSQTSGGKETKPPAAVKQDTVLFTIVGPSDVGEILKTTEVKMEKDDTVLDVLKRVTRANKIHMEFRGRGATAYIEGIDNIYEFDYGSGSGWMFNMNGKYPNRGAGVWPVKPGDKIEWRYTEDLGKDLGVEMGGLWDGKEE